MRPFWRWIVLFGIIGLCLAGSLSATEETTCEPITSPFEAPAANDVNGVIDAYSPNVTISRVCTFSGHVARGEVYTHEIVKGLIFCLRPSRSFHENDGWRIIISDATEETFSTGFNGHVTPPFHGFNPISIEGWHFRNDKNTAENDGSVNAPQKIREFNFLLNRSDFENVSSAHLCKMYNDCENGLTQDKAGEIIAATPKSRGVLTITDFELGNLIPNDKAWFESMDFKVRIYLPEK